MPLLLGLPFIERRFQFLVEHITAKIYDLRIRIEFIANSTHGSAFLYILDFWQHLFVIVKWSKDETALGIPESIRCWTDQLKRNFFKSRDSYFHIYFQVDEVKPVTNQENSGRCWLFACLNVMRLPFMKKYGIDDFEFSQR